MRLAELQNLPSRQPAITQEEMSRLQAMMPAQFQSLDQLPSLEELADLGDDELFQEV